MLAGVCGGIADYFALDPTIVRVIFVVALIVPPFGTLGTVIAYLALAVILPEPEGDGGDVTQVELDRIAPDGRLVIGVVLIILGGIFLLQRLPWWFGWFPGHFFLALFWPLLLIGIGAFLLMNARREP